MQYLPNYDYMYEMDVWPTIDLAPFFTNGGTVGMDGPIGMDGLRGNSVPDLIAAAAGMYLA